MTLHDRRIEVNVGRTVNLGNYESLRLDVSLGGNLEVGESVSDSVDQIYILLTDIINGKIAGAKEGNK